MPFDSTTYKPEVALEPWRKVLMDAADYIEAHGWAQGGTGTGRDHERCAGIAIEWVGGWFRGREATCEEAKSRFAAFIGVSRVTAIVDWNDTPGRTAAEVIAALRQCAAQ